ncbi:hypothetical protein BGW80DRAFT_1324321 [Lactifluus volemus]|nr:hypothetical protein BGW80DRAFT_1324321 [Lactifluus volemus]
MTKESCRQIILGGNLGATRSSTTVLDIRPQTVDPLPIMPLESSWIGTFPRCSMLEPRPAARMAPPRRATVRGMEPSKRSCRRGMLKKVCDQTPAGEKQEQHIQAQLPPCVSHGFHGWESERTEIALQFYNKKNIPFDPIQIFRSYILPQSDPCTNFEKSSTVSCRTPAIQTVLGL